MNTDGAGIIVTKAAAARRQLDAAIRLWLAEEDDLAVHSVAAAAYRILRDLMEHRGLQPLGEFLRTGLFSFAKELAKGGNAKLPDDTLTEDIIKSISEDIKSGKVNSPEDINVSKDPKGYWKKFAIHSNFLKHADNDPNNHIIESEINNIDLILHASGTYVRLFQDSSAEMLVFHSIFQAQSGDNSEFPITIALRDCKPELRRKLGLSLLSLVREQFFRQA